MRPDWGFGISDFVDRPIASKILPRNDPESEIYIKPPKTYLKQATQIRSIKIPPFSSFQMKDIEEIKHYSSIEEKINIISHAIGFILSIVALVLLVTYAILASSSLQH